MEIPQSTITYTQTNAAVITNFRLYNLSGDLCQYPYYYCNCRYARVIILTTGIYFVGFKHTHTHTYLQCVEVPFHIKTTVGATM